jgi:hypothetical protein
MNLEEYCTLLLMALEPEAHKNQELPLWVRNLRSKLDDSVFKELVPLLLADPNDPKYAGFGIGAGRKLEQSLFDGISDLESKTGHKMSQKERREIKEELSPLHDFEKKNFDKIPKSDLDELSIFSASILAGLESVYTKDGQLKHFEPRTRTVLFMLIFWPHIESKFKTRRECFEFLKANLGKHQIGNYWAVKKFFERIKYSPAKVGRPKKP